MCAYACMGVLLHPLSFFFLSLPRVGGGGRECVHGAYMLQRKLHPLQSLHLLTSAECFLHYTHHARVGGVHTFDGGLYAFCSRLSDAGACITNYRDSKLEDSN